MDGLIQSSCQRYVHDSLVITRNVESPTLLSSLGIPTELGSDTAWTFEPHPPEYGRKALRDAGWDEKTPVMVLCPIHPFVWPVKASIAKYIARAATGAYKNSQYRTVYFFESGAEVDRKYRHYISGLTKATQAFVQRHRVFPILVAMERLDAVACRDIAAHMPGMPVFTSDDYDMFQIVSILRACSYMVSSRYHGIVTCMPSLVASAGVTMDERIPNFLENIFVQLRRAEGRVVLREIRRDQIVSVTGREMLDRIERVRAYLRSLGVRTGDRCALLGPNSISWAVFHLACMAEGVIVVPLYSRQAPGEIAGMMKDCQPLLLFVSESALGDAVAEAWSEAPRPILMDEVLERPAPQSRLSDVPNPGQDSDIVTIIYTSGTSGEPKGVCLNVGNFTHMLSCTTERLDQLMGATHEPDRVFHYLPFSLAASTILLLSCLTRESVLALSTDLDRLADEIRLASPNYFLNVPTLLERVRRGVEEAISKRPAPIRSLFAKARSAWQRRHVGRGRALDALWLAFGGGLIFRKIRERFGT